MLSRFFVRLRALVARRRADEELDTELRYHLEQDAARHEARGLNAHDARLAARREFGNVTVVTEAARDEWRWTSAERLWQDVRHAVRLLRRRPGFTIAAVLCLTLGIGATTAIFSVVNAVILRPLPYPNAERIVAIWGSSATQPRTLISIPDLYDLRARNRTFDAIGVSRSQSVNVTGTEAPDRIAGNFVSAATLEIMGPRMAKGRIFRPEETEEGTGRQIVVLSYPTWQTRFAGDPNIIGRVVTLNGRPHEIVGVTAEGFQDAFSAIIGLWLPITSAPNAAWFNRGNANVWALGRVKRGISVAEAGRDLATIARQLGVEFPTTSAALQPRVIPLKQYLVGDIKPVLLTVLAFVAVVLLIACANVANLQLARAAARARELSVRAALGAGRARLVRQLLTESFVLSLLGGTAGVVGAHWAIKALVAAVPGGLPVFGPVGLDLGVLGFSIAVTVGAGVLFGTVPAFYMARHNLHDSLTSRSGDAATGARIDLRNIFVGVQIALCIVLLVGASLLTRSLASLQRIDPGFVIDHLLTAQLRLPAAKYPDDARIRDFMSRAITEIRAVPGVQSAALASSSPLSGNFGQVGYVVAGRPEPAPGTAPTVLTNTVSDKYFSTMGIPMLAGRDFDDRDRADGLQVVIVNDVLARSAWPGESAVGKRLRIIAQPEVWVTVVGVARSVQHITLNDPPNAQLYVPMTQSPGIFTSIVARTDGDPDRLAKAVRAAVWKVDRDQPVWAMRSMAWWYDTNVATPRFTMVLTGAFAALALVLAAIGVYGVMTFAVAQRTREMGIRMALGAQRGEVLRLVLGRGARILAVATAAGLILAFAAAKFIRTQLIGIGPFDPLTYTVVPAILATVALVACWLPARRAARVDPVIALRTD
jgi:putative ABC transport system permease protein